eukprot:s1455_g11.t1
MEDYLGDQSAGAVGISTVEDGYGGGEPPSVVYDGFNHTPHHILTYEIKDNPTGEEEEKVHLEPEYPATPPTTPDRRPSMPVPELYCPKINEEIDECVCSPSKFIGGWEEPDNQLGLETPGDHAPTVAIDHGHSLNPEDHEDLDGSDVEIIDVVQGDQHLDRLTRSLASEEDPSAGPAAAQDRRVCPKNLFPDIESDGYITRRDQFALRDQIQKEKQEKKEKAKAEKENVKNSKPRRVKKSVDKTAQPKRRGRPPKNPPVASVPAEGNAAGESEPKIEKPSKKKRERQQCVSTTPVSSPPKKAQATSMPAMEETPMADTGAASSSQKAKTDNRQHPREKSSTPTPLSNPRRTRKTVTKASEHKVDDKPDAPGQEQGSRFTGVDEQVDMEKPKSQTRRNTRKKEPTPKPAGGDVEKGNAEVTKRTRGAKTDEPKPAKNDQPTSGSKPSEEKLATQPARRRPPRLPSKSIPLSTEILTYDAVVAKCIELYKECPKGLHYSKMDQKLTLAAKKEELTNVENLLKGALLKAKQAYVDVQWLQGKELQCIEYFAGVANVYKASYRSGVPSTAVDIEYLKDQEGKENPFDLLAIWLLLQAKEDAFTALFVASLADNIADADTIPAEIPTDGYEMEGDEGEELWEPTARAEPVTTKNPPITSVPPVKQVRPQEAPPAPPSMSPSPEQLAQQLQEALTKIRDLENAQNQALVSPGPVVEPSKPNPGPSRQPAPEHDGSKKVGPTQKTRDESNEDSPMVTPLGKKVP